MLNYAICTVAAAPVRKEDAHRSEMTSQLLFGETMEVLEQKGDWFRIKSLHDAYEGWLTYHLIEPIDAWFAVPPYRYVTTGLISALTLPDGPVSLPMGSSLTGFDEETRLLWDGRHEYHGIYRDINGPLDPDLLWKSVHAWMNAPYLWGGRTFMGVDCSGFVGVVFKVLGIPLLRDAYQQATQGTPVESLEQSKPGDVAFFHNERGKITHVGILLNKEQIIHASGKVRIDQIDKTGITNSTNGKKTHELSLIRRFINVP
jgi:hypothetical protein